MYCIILFAFCISSELQIVYGYHPAISGVQIMYGCAIYT